MSEFSKSRIPIWLDRTLVEQARERLKLPSPQPSGPASGRDFARFVERAIAVALLSQA